MLEAKAKAKPGQGQAKAEAINNGRKSKSKSSILDATKSSVSVFWYHNNFVETSFVLYLCFCLFLCRCLRCACQLLLNDFIKMLCYAVCSKSCLGSARCALE